MEALESDRSVLLAGPTGAGKESLARHLKRTHGLPIGLLGGEYIDSPRALEKFTLSSFQDGNQIIYVDNANRMNSEVQEALGNIIDRIENKRIRSKSSRREKYLFILSSTDHTGYLGIDQKLAERLEPIVVEPACNRKADIPAIFKKSVTKGLCDFANLEDSVLRSADVVFYEKLCCYGLPKHNIEEIHRLIERASALYMNRRQGSLSYFQCLNSALDEAILDFDLRKDEYSKEMWGFH